jgi:hypothetical protein
MTIKYAKWPKCIPNGHKIYQQFPVKGPPKFIQIEIFGIKIYHLVTLLLTNKNFSHSSKAGIETKSVFLSIKVGKGAQKG